MKVQSYQRRKTFNAVDSVENDEPNNKVDKMNTILSNNGRIPGKVSGGVREREFFTIAVANQKGGVAKTTTSISLGGALVGYEQKVLLVDLDPHANLSLALGVNPEHVQESIADFFKGSISFEKVIRDSSIPGLYLMPSNKEMEEIAQSFVNHKNYEIALRSALRGLSESTSHAFDYVIMDCPPSSDWITLNAMVAADLLVIPTQPEFLSISALRPMMNLIQNVRSRYNPSLVYRILITMFDVRNKIHRTLSEQLRMTFKQGLFDTMISMDTKLRESTLYGLPISYYKHNTRSAFQYSLIAQELIEYVSEKKPSSA